MSWPTTEFNVGDSVVGLPSTSIGAGVIWIPEPSGFDSMCRVNGVVGRFLKDSTEEMLMIAKGLAPVDTGDLVASLSVAYGKWDDGIWGEVWTDVEYALYQEYGTVNHDATPFLRPALEAVMGQYDVEGSFAEDWGGEVNMFEGMDA